MPAESTVRDPALDMTAELVNHDHNIIAIRAEGLTRNQARVFFSREWDIEYADVRVRKTRMRVDLEHAAEVLADGGEEPYDGWPSRVAAKDEAAVEYWELTNDEAWD